MTEATAVFSVDGLELSRVMANALAFLPARSRANTARIQIVSTAPGAARLEVTATDTYAIGTDFCDVEQYEAPASGVRPCFELDRDGLAALDRIGRLDRKKTRRPVTVAYFEGDCLKVEADEANAEAAPIVAATAESAQLWDACDELMARLLRKEPALPRTIAFDPALLARFAKVRADKTERVADFLIYDNEAPVLVRIGPSFVGAVMPIARDVHAENVGADGLWNEAA